MNKNPAAGDLIKFINFNDISNIQIIVHGGQQKSRLTSIQRKYGIPALAVVDLDTFEKVSR